MNRRRFTSLLGAGLLSCSMVRDLTGIYTPQILSEDPFTNTITYQHTTYSLPISITRELIEDDLYGSMEEVVRALQTR